MINKVHERALEVLLNDHKSDFETLLQNNNEEGLAISENSSREFLQLLAISIYFFSIFPLSNVFSVFK